MECDGEMPREQITYERAPVQIDGDGFGALLASSGTPESSGQPITAFPTMHVCWTNGGTEGGGWAQFMFRCDPEYLRQLLRDQKPGDDVPVEIYTDVLSRSECNKAVRAVRRARDQAYGRDE